MPRHRGRRGVARLRLLPGERELVRLRPSPGAWLGRYLLASAWLAWAGALVAAWVMPWWARMVDAPGGGLLAILLMPAGPLALCALLYAARRRWIRFGLGAAGAVSYDVVALVAADASEGTAMLLLGAGLAIVALVLTELDRRRRAYHLTNLRILHLGGLWDRSGWTVHYDSVLDLDVRRSPLGRLLGYGTIDPVLSHPAEPATAKPAPKRKKNTVGLDAPASVARRVDPAIRDVGRLRVVRYLLEAFIKDATSNEYMRAEQQTQKRVGDALRALGAANHVPRGR